MNVMKNRWSGVKAFGIMMILVTVVMSSPANAQSAAENLQTVKKEEKKPVDNVGNVLGGVKA